MKGRVFDHLVLEMATEDNVVTTLDSLQEGAEFTYAGTPIRILEQVPFGHKVAVREFSVGDEVKKYGEIIGRATEPIEPGAWVHTHNCESTRGRGDVTRKEGLI